MPEITTQSIFTRKKSLCLNGRLMCMTRPLVMGILNITPDSFYDGGVYSQSEQKLTQRIEQLLTEGVDIIDVGAVSTRPGAKEVSVEIEWQRLSEAITLLRKISDEIALSVDTYRSDIVKRVFNEFGDVIINDISGGDFDEKMMETVACHQLPYIMMHIQGTPGTMQQNPVYEDVVLDIVKHFAGKVDMAKSLGINDMIIDPGFGFGKTQEHNYELLSRFDEFKIFNLPLLAGISRKSMIYKPLEITPEQALNGTTAAHTIALMKGANILRVHDVKEARELIKIVELARMT